MFFFRGGIILGNNNIISVFDLNFQNSYYFQPCIVEKLKRKNLI